MSAAAKALKESGNEAFKTGKYADAIALYTEAMKKDPSDATYPLNRSMAYLKLQKYTEAERDATKSLNLLPAGNAKALYRRATARKALGKIDLARQDLQAVLLEDPTNPAAKAELAALPATESSSSSVRSSPNTAKATSSPPSSKADVVLSKASGSDKGKGRAAGPVNSGSDMSGSQPPIKIATPIPATAKAYTNGDSQDDKRSTDRRSALKAAITPESDSTSNDLMQPVSTRRLNGAGSDKAAATSAPSPQLVSTPPAIEKGQTAKRDFRSLRATREERQRTFPPSPVATAPASKAPTQQKEPAGAPSIPEVKPPSTMFEFETRWRDRPERVWRRALLQAVQRQQIDLPAFFGQTLSPELVDDMLICLAENAKSDATLRQVGVYFLDGLSRSARFDFVSMLCGETASVKAILTGETEHEAEIRARWGV